MQTLILASESMSAGCLTGADVASLVAACPRLKEFHLRSTVREGEDTAAALLQLPPSCSSLGIEGNAFGDDVAVVLQQHQQTLRRLHWGGSTKLTDVGVLALTELTALTRLVLLSCESAGPLLFELELPNPEDSDTEVRVHG